MAVVENSSLSKAACDESHDTSIAKSIKDFEAVLGKRLFKARKVWYEFNLRRTWAL